MKYRVRFNKKRGQEGRGTVDHVWRVFNENNKEWLCKHIKINVPCYGEREGDSEDWNIVCEADSMDIDYITKTITLL